MVRSFEFGWDEFGFVEGLLTKEIIMKIYGMKLDIQIFGWQFIFEAV